MEWQKNGFNQNANIGMMQVNVMTDEQVETLRKQIAVYSVLSEQLIQTHKTLSSQQDLTLTGKFVTVSYFSYSFSMVSQLTGWSPVQYNEPVFSTVWLLRIYFS
jgi:hypothetical protein